MPRPAPKAHSPILEHQTARSVLLALSPQHLALPRVSNALAATTVPLAPHHGLLSIADVATTALTALVFPRPAPTKCLLLADGALSKSKALHSSWTQPTASITASGTLRQATACSANARPIPEHFTFFPLTSPIKSHTHLQRTCRALATHYRHKRRQFLSRGLD